MEIFLFIFFLLLAGIVYRQSSRIRELKWHVDGHDRAINDLKHELASLRKPSAEGSAEQAAVSMESTESVGVETSGAAVEEVRLEIPKPLYSPPPVPDPVRSEWQYAEPEVPDQAPASGAEAKTELSDRGINWENFLGAKLFAWIGGLSLFIGFAFLLKYSFDHNLISPAVRVAMGFMCGAGLIAGGMHLKRKTYEVTSQTLAATGIVILYASGFAAHSIYHFIGAAFTVVLMSLITAGAFVLAAGTHAKVVAILGIAGGFLTYPILSSGQDQPLALFSYITFLNVGLFGVALYRKWNFLAVLGAIGTILVQLYWVIQFFNPEKGLVGTAIYLWFDLLFFGAFWYGQKVRRSDLRLAGSAVALPFFSFLFALILVLENGTCMRPGLIFSCLLGADLCLLGIALMERRFQKFHLVAGGCVFFVLSLWISIRMTPELLIWALGGSLVFALLHSAVPIIAARVFPCERTSWQLHIFPLLTLLLTLIPIIKGNGGSWLIWPFVLLFNAGILILALFTTSALVILAALVITGIVVLGWIFSGAAGDINYVGALVLVGAFGLFFSVVSTFVLNRIRRKTADAGNAAGKGIPNLFDISNPENFFIQIPALSALFPFLLLILASGRIQISNPASILGLGCILAAIATGLSRFLKTPALLPIAMSGFFLLEATVHLQHFNRDNSFVFLGFYLLAASVFYALPFYFQKDYRAIAVPWANAALSGPLHFFLVYDVVDKMYPNNFMGLLPAVMAVPYFFGLTTLLNWIPEASEKRNAILAWFGGTTLFFITLIFPIQFDHQWLTVSWALEGAALIWLFRKVPHTGLRGLGICLLLVSFIRLGLNPAILLHYPHSTYPIFNWYLYTYGIAVFCLMSGGRMLASPRNRAFGINIPPVLYSLGTILSFILMNIEIADLFSPGLSLKFQFTGDLARGMSYSIAWALFALGLLIVGIRKKLRPVRFSAIGLIGLTLLKLFFFDLNRLDQLYRIGAFIGVAIVLIAASALYQKWIVHKEHDDTGT